MTERGSRPSVSIIIPAFNREVLIQKLFDSISVQSDPNWECIVVDDGSTDETCSVVQGYGARDSRFRLARRDRPPKGPSTCRNIGLEHARGDWILYLDSDDLLAKDCVKNRLRLIATSPDALLAVFNMGGFYHEPGDTSIVINQYVEEENDTYLLMFLRHDLPWAITCPLWRRSFLTDVGGFSEDLPCFEDPELHTRALLRNPPLAVFRDAPVDCFRRFADFIDPPPGHVDRCIDGYTHYFKKIVPLLSSHEEGQEGERRIEALKTFTGKATNLLLLNRLTTSSRLAWEFFWTTKRLGLAGWHNFCHFAAQYFLPEVLIHLIWKLRLAKVFRLATIRTKPELREKI